MTNPTIKIYKKGVLVTETTDMPTGLASFALNLEQAMQDDNASLEMQVFEGNGVDATSLVFTKTTRKMHVQGHLPFLQSDAQVPDDVCDDDGKVVTERCRECGAEGADLAKPCTRAMG